MNTREESITAAAVQPVGQCDRQSAPGPGVKSEKFCLSTPLGDLEIEVDLENAAVTGVDFANSSAGAVRRPRSPIGRVLVQQFEQYFDGRDPGFNVPLALAGTGFQNRVWRALLEIPFGETRSYGEIARRIGSPAASRAVGAACGKNPVAILVPCHRVVGKDGSLTGFAGGIGRKQWLLLHEQSAG